MHRVMDVAMVGSSSLRVGRGDDPDMEVSIRFFIGFMKHPSGRPRRSKFWQRNSVSSSGVQVEMSSTNPRRWVMPPPPLPSSPGLPCWSLCWAHSLRSLLSERRRQATTSEAKMGESGQP
jgi:hypothetical protein